MNKVMQIAGMLYAINQNNPELRLCQILSIAAKEAGWKDNDLFYLEDKQLIEGLKIMSMNNS